MEAQEILRRVKAIAQAKEREARDNNASMEIPTQQVYYRGQIQAFQHIVELIESLEGNRWEKKAREIVTLHLNWGPDIFEQKLAQALSEAYDEGYQLGQEQSGRCSADR